MNFDRQSSRGEFLFLLKKLKEIRSRLVCEEYTLNLLHNGDEKKDEKVDHERIVLEVSPNLLRELNYAESQLRALIGELPEGEAHTRASNTHTALFYVIRELENQVRKARSQKG